MDLIGKYEAMGGELGSLVDEKQKAYGDSFGKSGNMMRILYPEGIMPTQLDDALAMVRVLDKLFRIATNKDAFGENPWKDIAGYALLGMGRSVDEKQKMQAKAGEVIFCDKDYRKFT